MYLVPYLVQSWYSHTPYIPSLTKQDNSLSITMHEKDNLEICSDRQSCPAGSPVWTGIENAIPWQPSLLAVSTQDGTITELNRKYFAVASRHYSLHSLRCCQCQLLMPFDCCFWILLNFWCHHCCQHSLCCLPLPSVLQLAGGRSIKQP